MLFQIYVLTDFIFHSSHKLILRIINKITLVYILITNQITEMNSCHEKISFIMRSVSFQIVFLVLNTNILHLFLIYFHSE